jgi:hypothetical protein
MSNELEMYHNILFIDRPWLDNKTSGQKYQQLYHALSKENLAQQPIYEFAFPKPLTSKRKYFYKLFENEANRYINTIHSLISQASNENEKKYWIHPTLTKKLKDKLTQTETVIKSNNFFLSHIDDKSHEQKHTDDAYIIQCLKYQLIRLYLEIQNSFPAYVKEDLLTEDDIHSLYFSEPAPAKSFLVPATPLNLPKPATAIVIKPAEQTFKVIKGDIREDQRGILNYADIIAKPDSFALAEEEFFSSELLDLQYKFIKKRGNVEKMAALYHILIQKQHFKTHSFKDGRKKITDLQIRKFLNHRYIATIDREFRNFKDKPTLDEYLSNHVALPLLIPF